MLGARLEDTERFGRKSECVWGCGGVGHLFPSSQEVIERGLETERRERAKADASWMKQVGTPYSQCSGQRSRYHWPLPLIRRQKRKIHHFHNFQVVSEQLRLEREREAELDILYQ